MAKLRQTWTGLPWIWNFTSISIIHRYYVDIHGYIHIRRCISNTYIHSLRFIHSPWTAAYTSLSQCSHTRNGTNLFSVSTKMAFACTSSLFRLNLAGIGAYVTFFSNNRRKSSKHQQSVPNTKHTLHVTIQSCQHYAGDAQTGKYKHHVTPISLKCIQRMHREPTRGAIRGDCAWDWCSMEGRLSPHPASLSLCSTGQSAAWHWHTLPTDSTSLRWPCKCLVQLQHVMLRFQWTTHQLRWWRVWRQ